MGWTAARLTRLIALAALACCAAARPAWCPEPWPETQCLGTSGTLAAGAQVPYAKGDERVTWQDGMAGHTHYTVNASRTALFVIDPQTVYAACPKTGPPFEVSSLISGPTDDNFDGHSPLCCDKFYPALANTNMLAERARKLGIPVFAIAHIYRDFDGDGEVDNCGRICDYDVLGWTGWPMAWNLWSEQTPWHSMVYKGEHEGGFNVDFSRDYYVEKSVYSAFTEPVVAKLRSLGVDTVVITGYMTQFCCVTSSRHGSDLGFRIVFVTDACDGPVLAELLSTVDENKIVPFHLGIAVADTVTTEALLGQLNGLAPRDEL
mmetsp:Transcript_77541/g.179751  ORF Transcript_77541/g.179751 Transcript_77541/m.179751 type:complete len:319 (-) Transcript_77541:106-1062(-)|eukprot:CAMPEP_0171110360 /NCGR_PEP_ID=MMETSP0766_2-20121228/71305_1 /TAXON_ID=439317 /ORGANISM="Gambierdiscus australes, Strain CAWD 149" /LENGTH=318 /DNA_ID=CAMNT_0011572221 /DNA_START=70 /DNA_END=1026 /DNA_ORIENTATION=-